MQQTELITGFSELKELLIKTYHIDRDRLLIRLYFTENDYELLMHDDGDHSKVITLCFDVKMKIAAKTLTGKSYLLIQESLLQPSAADYLNGGFKLYGFFRL